ncbi:DUF397 domain-containing protein [Actinomadura sp. 6N118]|uniref:DUF397 domain-containing protein n=1 Tax=Actinomadura sp. 6N118 TaxID=3375151 RepID=UPI0037A85E43
MTQWRKSSQSLGEDNSNCVEIARLAEGIGVRDSKAPDAGDLALSTENFADLVARVKRAELNL